jgi:hypothetical protein
VSCGASKETASKGRDVIVGKEHQVAIVSKDLTNDGEKSLAFEQSGSRRLRDRPSLRDSLVQVRLVLLPHQAIQFSVRATPYQDPLDWRCHFMRGTEHQLGLVGLREADCALRDVLITWTTVDNGQQFSEAFHEVLPG